jgi:hypothetical protein
MSCLDLERLLGRDGWAGDAVDAFHNNLAKLAFFAFAQVVGLVGWLVERCPGQPWASLLW